MAGKEAAVWPMTPTKNQPNCPSHPAKNATATFTNPRTMAAACAFRAGREDMRKGGKMTEFTADDLRSIEMVWSDELESLRRDAERYRKLRGNHWSNGQEVLTVTRSKSVTLGSQTYSGELLDAAIDAMEAADGKP